MKQLMILRHAQSLSTEIGSSDKERKLSPNGIADAQALGMYMAKEGFTPNAALCSAATRTRQTLAGVLESVEIGQIDYAEHLYNAGPQELLNAIQGVGDGVETLLIVAHNPGVHALAASLAREDDAAIGNRLAAGYAPATLTVLECDIENWADLKPYENNVKLLVEPLDYNAPDRPTRWM